MNGTDLLAEFVATRAEAAFGELVRKYTNLVYSIARRRVGEMSLAEEITQLVFIRLAKAPPKLAAEGQLLSWLHRTTVYVSIDLWRSESRRRAREQKVFMQPDATEETSWNELAPILDEALDGLDDADRHVIFLRFFEQKTMADLGHDLGVSEDAAKMRVSRAVTRLRTQLGGLGASCSATLLATLLYERSVEAAPSTLAGQLAAIRVVPAGGLVAGLIHLLSGAASSKVIPAAAAAAAILIGLGVLLAVHGIKPGSNRGQGNGVKNNLDQNGLTTASLTESNLQANANGEQGDPDPVKLLQGIVRARQRISSGIIEYDIASVGNVTRADATNSRHLKIQFEDGHLWAESFGQEYSYVTPVPNSPQAEETVKRADAMPREQAIREGLVEPFLSHHVTIYDGQIETDYWEAGNSLPRTDIRDAGQSGNTIFDPRCLDLSTVLFVKHTVENCVPYRDAKAVELIGKESIDGHSAWHIQFLSKYDYKFDYWIDALYPTRMLKVEDQVSGNRRVSLSRYSDSDFKDPLPVEVKNLDYQNGMLRYEQRFVRGRSDYGVSIDASTWALEGLHMKLGTPVSDGRKFRRLGYWNGTGLSDDFPSKAEPQQHAQAQTPALNRQDWLALLENEPASSAGFGAALWVLTNSPDGADVQKAAESILQSHIQSPDLGKLIDNLERMRPSCSSNLLRAVLDVNPDADLRGKACLALATLRKDACGFGANASATVEAEKLYERVISDFGRLPGERGYTLAQLAEPSLAELRNLTIGKVAPDIDGQDIYGNPMKLSDYRGQVVALLFWSALSFSESDSYEFNRVVDQMQGKPFLLLGIHADDYPEKARALVEKYQLKWSSFQDAREGPTYKTYNIATSGWPTIYLLDRKGVIRYRGLRFGTQISAAAEKLLQE